MAFFSIWLQMMTGQIEMENDSQGFFALTEALKKCAGDSERIEVLSKHSRVVEAFESSSSAWLKSFSATLSLESELILKSLIAIGQAEQILAGEKDCPIFLEKLKAVFEDLIPVEIFYKEMGGIVGYHQTMLSFLCANACISSIESASAYHRPPGIDITAQNATVDVYILQGIVSLPLLAEIYPVGGAADRLKFYDPLNGQPLPAAKLHFCGHTLLEGMIRDVQAREYLYYKLFGEQITTPIAMMTSSEKDNHRHILELCENHHWFGRPRDCFRLFCQPVVPTMDRKGKWCWSGLLKLLMKPGGHGVIWKVAKEEGVLDWFERLGRKKILVRQINNPIAGIDYGLLAFCGVGFREDKSFGFASCPRQTESAEGVNVLLERKGPQESRYCLTNIEYCDFPKFGVEDVPAEPGSPYSQFPSNTNILFADISAVKEAVMHCPLPGMLVNLKAIVFVDEEGNIREQELARLETMMQNLADCFEQPGDVTSSPQDVALKTYLTYNLRQKTISTTKKLFQEGASLLETPEGCFYDLLCNAYDLLTHHCHIALPEMLDRDFYTLQGPPFLFSCHPALGPLFAIIGQKIRGGRFHLYSECKLEIAEVDIEHLELRGSLHVIADRVMGQIQEDGILKYSDQVGCVCLRHVIIENRGFDPTAPNSYWKGEIARHELCEILLRGNAEFVAENVVLRGNMRIEVEDGFRMTAFEERGELKFKKEAL